MRWRKDKLTGLSRIMAGAQGSTLFHDGQEWGCVYPVLGRDGGVIIGWQWAATGAAHTYRSTELTKTEVEAKKYCLEYVNLWIKSE